MQPEVRQFLQWLFYVILVVWFCQPLKEERKVPLKSKAAAVLCLIATIVLHVFGRNIQLFSARSIIRIAAYMLYLKLMKGYSIRRSLYYSLILWLSFNFCFDIFISPNPKNWQNFPVQYELLAMALIYLVYGLLLLALRAAIPFSQITEPNNLRIVFILTICAAVIVLKEVINPQMQSNAYFFIVELVLELSVVIFERYLSQKENDDREKLLKLSEEYRFTAAISHKQAEDNVRRIHHDMKNHMLAIQNLVDDPERLKEYVAELTEGLGAYDTAVSTGNVVVDGIVSQKLKEASERKIDLNINLDLAPCEGRISEMDMCVIIGNLLDNALEASNKVTAEDKRSVLIRSRKVSGSTVISVSNYMEGGINLSEGLPKTTKRDKSVHGLGLSSVRRSAEKYGGSLTLETPAEDRIVATVTLPSGA